MDRFEFITKKIISFRKPTLESMTEYSNRIEKLKKVLNKNIKVVPKIEQKQPSLKDIRQELLGTKDVNSTTGLSMSNNETEVGMLLNYHSDQQDKIANEMLTLTKNLKEQTILAGNIIRNDTQVCMNS